RYRAVLSAGRPPTTQAGSDPAPGRQRLQFQHRWPALVRIRRVITKNFGVIHADLQGCGNCCTGWAGPISCQLTASSNATRTPSPSGSSTPGPRSKKGDRKQGVDLL